MARFDVYRLRDGSLVLDCQADLLDYLHTRFAVPLFPASAAPDAAARLNPAFMIEGESFIMVTQYASVVQVAELGRRICSLSDEHYRIMAALDMLISGF